MPKLIRIDDHTAFAEYKSGRTELIIVVGEKLFRYPYRNLDEAEDALRRIKSFAGEQWR